MSSLFAQINQLNQEAQQQRSLAQQDTSTSVMPGKPPTSSTTVTEDSNDIEAQHRDTFAKITDNQDVVAPPSGTTVPHSGTTAEVVMMNEQTRTIPRKATRSTERQEGLGKGSRLDLDKLKTVIEELSVMQANTNGLNVRMSAREHQDIEDFIVETLRKHGLKGNQVSTAKLMRYAMRYMFRVHPQEFVAALRAALQVEESLSI